MAKFTAKDFVEYVNDEFDSETLQLLKNTLDERLIFLRKMGDMANPRTVVQGYRLNKQDLKEAQTLYESIGADLDILAQESSSFKQFISKIKSSPEYKKLDITDPQVNSFLLTIYDSADGLSEARGFTTKELRLKAIALLKSIGVPTSEENIQDILGGLIAKIKKYNAGSVLAEVVKSSIRSEVVLMITELAEGYGVKIPTHTESGSKKEWKTITKMAEYAVRGIDSSNRKSFIRDVMRIKKAINNDEIVI